MTRRCPVMRRPRARQALSMASVRRRAEWFSLCAATAMSTVYPRPSRSYKGGSPPPSIEHLQGQAHAQGAGARAVRSDVIALALAHLGEAEAAIEGEGALVAVLDLEMNGADARMGEALQVVGEERARIAAAARLRRHGDAQDLRLVRNPAGDDEAGRLRRPVEKQAVRP